MSANAATVHDALLNRTFGTIAARKTETQTESKHDVWRPGSPAIEAAALFRLVGKNGGSIDDLRGLIRVPPVEEEEVRKWCQSEPNLRNKIQVMIRHRELCLAAFNRLVKNAHGDDSSCPTSA